MSWRLGVDIGGTFTDVVLAEEGGEQIAVVKVSTTPRDFARGVLDALATALKGHDLAPADVTFLAHATTVVTNALLEGKGARTALITTRGFRDVLELRRSARAALYDLFQDAPAVLVPRRGSQDGGCESACSMRLHALRRSPGIPLRRLKR